MSLTITVTDNADGTGGVATITGAATGTVTVFSSLVSGGYPGAWVAQGQRNGNGTLAVAPGTGRYFWGCRQSLSISDLIYQPLTDPDPTLTTIERITAELANRIEDCTTGNGYAVNVVDVIRPNRSATKSPRDYAVVLTQGDATRNSELDMAANPARIGYEVPFLIEGVLMPSDTSTTPHDTLCNLFAGELQRAVCQPAATWHSFGGEAFNAEWGDIEHRLEGDGGPSGCRITLTVYYRIDETDPRIARP